jgi:hypothetical protein
VNVSRESITCTTVSSGFANNVVLEGMMMDNIAAQFCSGYNGSTVRLLRAEEGEAVVRVARNYDPGFVMNLDMAPHCTSGSRPEIKLSCGPIEFCSTFQNQVDSSNGASSASRSSRCSRRPAAGAAQTKKLGRRPTTKQTTHNAKKNVTRAAATSS